MSEYICEYLGAILLGKGKHRNDVCRRMFTNFIKTVWSPLLALNNVADYSCLLRWGRHSRMYNVLMIMLRMTILYIKLWTGIIKGWMEVSDEQKSILVTLFTSQFRIMRYHLILHDINAFGVPWRLIRFSDLQKPKRKWRRWEIENGSIVSM